MNGKFDGDDVKETLSFNCSDILMGPTIYSYSCVNVTLSSGTSSLTFSQFQVRLISVILLGCLLNKSCRSSNLMINIIIPPKWRWLVVVIIYVPKPRSGEININRLPPTLR